jgi:hypothetical protein
MSVSPSSRSVGRSSPFTLAINDRTSTRIHRSIGTVDFFIYRRKLFGRFGTPDELGPPIFPIFGSLPKNDRYILLRFLWIWRKCADRPENVVNVTVSFIELGSHADLAWISKCFNLFLVFYLVRRGLVLLHRRSGVGVFPSSLLLPSDSGFRATMDAMCLVWIVV